MAKIFLEIILITLTFCDTNRAKKTVPDKTQSRPY